mmetsp:Transcript_10103/g.39451  ORF Transcript_10103/g.39451 Transcript_10103/m.39451 type:complete len:395 (+) Transcript_10103:228-1412(+)
MHAPGRDTLQARHRLERARRAERVAEHRLGRVEPEPRLVDGAKHRVDGGHLAQVAHGRGRAVRVDEVHRVRLEPGVRQRRAHAQDHVPAVGARRGQVVRVCRDAAAEVLAEDRRAALLGVSQGLHDQDAGALAHDEAVAALIPRAGRAGRVFVAGGERAARDEAADAGARARRLGAPREDEIRLAGADVRRGVDELIVARRARGVDCAVLRREREGEGRRIVALSATGGGRGRRSARGRRILREKTRRLDGRERTGVVGSPEAELGLHAQDRAAHVREQIRHGERRHLLDPLGVERHDVILVDLHAAHGAAHQDAATRLVQRLEIRAPQPGVPQGALTRADGVLVDSIHAPRLLSGEVVAVVELLDRRSDARGEIVKDSGLPRGQVDGAALAGE